MLKKIFIGIPRRILVLDGCFTILWGVMNAYLTSVLAKVTAANIIQKDFLRAAIFFIGYILLWEVVEFTCDYADSIAKAYVRNGNFNYYFKKLYFTKPEALQRGNTGYIAGILTQLIERKSNMLFSFIFAGVSAIYVVYVIFYIGIYSMWFSLIVFLLAVLGILTRLICSSLIEKPLKEMTVARGEQTRIFMDGINNISTIQKLRGLQFIEKKAAVFHKNNLTTSRRFTLGNELGFCIYKTINYLLCPICMFVALSLYNKNPGFPMIEFMAYLSIVTVQLVHNVKNIAGFINDYNLYATSQKEMDQIVEEQSPQYTSTSIGNDFHCIAMKDITYQYTTGQGSITIEIPDFHINKGEKICITGESGQGKTTLLKILSGMIESENHLYVDGKCIHKNIDAVYIAQDTEMLDMTLRDNLTFGNTSISDETLINMLDAVGMGEWYERQEKGLDTLLGERGVFVSTGQRQRLNILRGLLIDKEIYLLDEPTSNVDDATEDKMIRLIEDRLRGKTVIIVTHKDSIRSICNREYSFNNNRIMEVA
ncbi:ABC transporter ATP-binding protein [Lachnospiraceae bacterium MD1]|jgi:ABC-type bacteriocin/lantibiotic exporter with double-glycine peptidase domain|uniref:ABC transporter ATP-binding protein n=1 Tax=Variimorphobacter saccharofermentans TaxID=2755051 RepID=A0A839JY33_9FIRM|nr:ABC transporter ATP-binding protein [Variimorphobacter saccharofermentans]MBB2182138.1 ABC transporter ATP-binding protein [Variimorphobacter saccharofermentans]